MRIPISVQEGDRDIELERERERERYCLEKRLALLAFCRIGSSIFDDLDGFWMVLLEFAGFAGY